MPCPARLAALEAGPPLTDLCSIETRLLALLGAPYTKADVECYIDCHFTSQGALPFLPFLLAAANRFDLDYMIPYAKLAWAANVDNCPLGN